MKFRWANSAYNQKNKGFTIVELIIVIVVIAILAAISIVTYGGVQQKAATSAIQSDLEQVTHEMTQYALSNSGAFPTTLPTQLTASPNVILTLRQSGTSNYYAAAGTITPVQNGVLLAQICQDLINENVGKGVNQGGQTNAYITGCGNWNNNSMQITGWNSRVYSTPVTDTTLLNYADNFTTNDTWNKSQETVVKNFYHLLVSRLNQQGGYFPVTSFWDSWANSSNGGVMTQPLPTPQPRPYYCVEATHASYSTLKWHVTDDNKLQSGAC